MSGESRFLKNQKIKAEYHYLNKKWRRKIYQDKTIVFIARSSSYPAGHYLIRDKKFWMDPWVNFFKEKEVKKAKAGFRKKLPGRPIYGIFIG